MQFGYEVIKQIGRAVESVDEPEWYDVLAEVLQALNRSGVSRQLIQTWFYLRFAGLMGHGLSLTHDVAGRRLQPEGRYRYDVSEKGLRLDERGDLTADHIKYLRLVSVKSLLAVAQVGGVEGILPECWFVARQHAAL
jgi:DNA repair protein RecO (recombination protein O)